ncbi:MAG: DinB family protein [Fimbriimonadaceae bacterium]|nr:DinB family protein [Chthonomonadaceae bacterium]MCO5295565.1 DinB family protein [Fimbriimonadaceae bacterium]
MHAYLVPGLRFGPTIVRRLFERIAPARWDEATAGDRFTPREVIAHLADWEPIMLQRLVSAVEKPGSTVLAYDEAERAIEQGYAQSDPAQELDRFEAGRAVTVRYVEGLDPAVFGNTFIHPERGPMTVDDQANMLLGHDLYHLEQLSGFLGDKLADVW